MDSSICLHFSLFATTFFGCKSKIQPFLVVKDKNNRKRLLFSIFFRNFAPEATKYVTKYGD